MEVLRIIDVRSVYRIAGSNSVIGTVDGNVGCHSVNIFVVYVEEIYICFDAPRSRVFKSHLVYFKMV